MTVTWAVFSRVDLAGLNLAPFTIFQSTEEARFMAGVTRGPIAHLLDHQD